MNYLLIEIDSGKLFTKFSPDIEGLVKYVFKDEMDEYRMAYDKKELVDKFFEARERLSNLEPILTEDDVYFKIIKIYEPETFEFDQLY